MFCHSSSSQRFSIRSTSDESFSQLNTLSKNKYIISRISKFAAMTNKQHFKNTIEKRFKKWGISDDLEYLHISDEEIIDEFGRCTFFYVKIGPHIVQILQPGSFTFNSGIESGAQLVCHHDGCQQNGPVMGMGCACFLTKVLTELTKQYQLKCIKNQKNVNNFCIKSYKQAVNKVLKQYCKEDAMEHGRYLELKGYLNRIGKIEKVDIQEENEKYYYIKDIALYKGEELETFDVENLDISAEELEQIKSMRVKDQKYQDIEQYFVSESEKKHAMHVDFRNTLKFFLYAKNGIWENKDIALMQLEFVFEGLERTLESDPQFSQIDDDEDANTKQSKDEGQQDIKYPRILEKKPQNINEIKCVDNDNNEMAQYTQEVNHSLEKLEENYDFSKNEKLMEYYSRLKRGLDSKMKSALIADSEIFQFKSSTAVDILLELSEIVPEIGIIFKCAGLILQQYQEEKLKEDLDKLASIYSNFENLPKIIARKVTILKRKFIMDLDEHFIRDYFDPKFISHINKIKNKKKVQLPEALAIKDLSVIESCCISMVYSNELIPNKETSDISVANKVINYYKGYQIVNQVSGVLEEGEQPEFFERVVGFIIPDDLFEDPKVPKFLKRGIKDKDPEQHKQRVKTYLKKLNQCQLFDILGAINPTDPKHQPLQELIQEVNRGKEKFCTIF